MAFKRTTASTLRAYIYFKKKGNLCTVKELSKEVGVSRATIFRIQKKGVVGLKTASRNYSPGRPRKLSKRTERNVVRIFKKLRAENANFTSAHLFENSKLKDFGVSNRTLRRTLNNGYGSRTARRKRILLPRDIKEQLRFARWITKDKERDFWTKEVNFYLDGVSFYYKRNPVSQARAPQGKIWRKKDEGLALGCTAKGKKEGTGGKVVRLFVSISKGRYSMRSI